MVGIHLEALLRWADWCIWKTAACHLYPEHEHLPPPPARRTAEAAT